MAKERPILFSGEMVRAILDGRKTQTRRVVKVPTKYAEWTLSANSDGTARLQGDGVNTWLECPYGQPGDLLWVKEGFRLAASVSHLKPSDIAVTRENDIFYRADNGFDAGGTGWKPSIFMPRSLSRITLRVTDVRVERVQEISGADVLAEGVSSHVHPDADYFERAQRDAFAKLWDQINAKRGYSWDSNPWVWVVEFEKVEVL